MSLCYTLSLIYATESTYKLKQLDTIHLPVYIVTLQFTIPIECSLLYSRLLSYNNLIFRKISVRK